MFLVSVEKSSKRKQVLRILLCYAGAIDNPMLLLLNALATQQRKCTMNKMKQLDYYVDHAATHFEADITFTKTYMIFVIHSDAS